MENLENIATNYLESNSVNWRMGVELNNKLALQNPALAFACLKRSIELKPTLVKRFNLKSPELIQVANTHQTIALDDCVSVGTYFKVPTINSKEIIDLEIFSILSNEISRCPTLKKIRKQEKIFGFGSCFAINFVNYLNKVGLDAYSTIISEDINCPINNLLLLKWIFQNEESRLILDLKQLNPDIERLTLLKRFKESDHIFLTLGSSFYLINNQEKPEITLKPTKNTRYSLQTISSAKESIKELVKLIHLFNNKVNIFITVSPIPLRGVLDARNPVAANIASKAVLRAAIEELIIEQELSFTYLPIYDAIIGLCPYLSMPAFGTDDGESRHLNGFIINSMMKQVSQLIVEE